MFVLRVTAKMSLHLRSMEVLRTVAKELFQELQTIVSENLDENWYDLTYSGTHVLEEGVLMKLGETIFANLVIYNPRTGEECFNKDLMFTEDTNIDDLAEYIHNSVWELTSLMYEYGY